MEVGHRIPVFIAHTDKLHRTVVPQHQIVADIVGPVSKTEARIEDILPPAPLIKSGTHRDRTPRRVPVVSCAHIVVLKCL